MSTDREATGIVRSWLEEGVTRLPDRVLDAVLDQVPATPQRRLWWPVWRPNHVNIYAKLLAGAAAVLVVAVVGYQLLAGRPGPGGPSVGPSQTAAPPSRSATQTPTASVASPAPTQMALPSGGPLAIGPHRIPVEGVPLTLEIAEPGWSWDGEVFMGKGTEGDPAAISLLLWPNDPDFVYADSCGETRAQAVGPGAADMAAAIAGMSQLELVSGPTTVTVDGNQAQHVVVRVPDELECEPNAFWLWGDTAVSRYATAAGSTYAVWIIDVDGNRVQIDAESFAGAGPGVAEEIQAVISSIRFE